MSASPESVDDRLQNEKDGNMLDTRTLDSPARGTDITNKGAHSTSVSDWRVSQQHDAELHRHITYDDPHQAALEDNPEKAERLTVSSLLAVFVG
jgi:hypothetical protein